jgi:hypothetical protein
MIFSIQHYLEDYFHQRNLSDVDQYAVKLANLYALRRTGKTEPDFLKVMNRLQTAFYRNNSQLDRKSVERDLLMRLDRRFKKKLSHPGELKFPGGVASERASMQRLPRRSIGDLLRLFKHAMESRAVDTIWSARAVGRLRSRPEKVAQGLLSLFAMGVLSNGRGNLLRELASGVGFVDLVLMFGNVSHLVEMKVLRGAFTGVTQLAAYMVTERRHEGWLVVFDARPPGRRTALPEQRDTPAGTVRIVAVDINPTPPSRLKNGSTRRFVRGR